MRKIYYSRKLNQLKVLSRRVRFLLRQSDEEAISQLHKLRSKLKKLLSDLKFAYSGFELKRILGAAILVFGLSFSNQAHAQWFEAPVENPFNLSSTSVIAIPALADLDNDGDLDLLVGEYNANMQYFENTGSASAPSFASPLLNPFGIGGIQEFAFPVFVDIDNDGDMDLFSGNSFYDPYTYIYGGSLYYFENIGTPSLANFADPIENPFGLTSIGWVPFATFADLDDDGDFDILIGSSVYDYAQYTYATGSLNYFENIGSPVLANFATPVENPFGLSTVDFLPCPALGDIDLDGDMDLLVGQYYGTFQYFENIGSASDPDFDMGVENPYGLVSVYENAFPIFGDLDGDGDLDLLSGEYYGAFQYFENVNTVGIEEAEAIYDLNLYPNPVKEVLTINSDKQIDRIELIDVLGKTSMHYLNGSNQLSVGDLSPGMYTLKISFSDGSYAVKKILKE
jgi:hypothetical protein